MKIEMKDEVGAGVVYNLKLRDASKDEQERLNECFEFYNNSIHKVDKTKKVLLIAIYSMLTIGIAAAGLQNTIGTGILLALLLAMSVISFQYCRHCYLKDIHTLVIRDCIKDWEKEGKPTRHSDE